MFKKYACTGHFLHKFFHGRWCSVMYQSKNAFQTFRHEVGSALRWWFYHHGNSDMPHTFLYLPKGAHSRKWLVCHWVYMCSKKKSNCCLNSKLGANNYDLALSLFSFSGYESTPSSITDSTDHSETVWIGHNSNWINNSFIKHYLITFNLCVHPMLFGSNISINYLIIWLTPWAGKMNRILCCDWLPKWARWSYLARLGLRTVFRKKNFSEAEGGSPNFSFAICAVENIFRDS